MNDVTSVPARIVVIGTSKTKLAERFKNLSPERPERRVSRRSSPDAISSGRSSRPPPEPRGSFLRDDYMDNDLFVDSRRVSRRENGPFFNRITKRPPNEYLSDLSEEDEEVVRLPDHMPRRQRQFEVLFNGNGWASRPRSRYGSEYNYGENEEETPMRGGPRTFPNRRHFVYVNRRRFRPFHRFTPVPTPLPKRLPVSIPLEERISILRKHNQMPFVRRGYRANGPFARRPFLKRLQHFVPRDRDRFGAGRFRDRRSGPGRRQFNDSNNPRAKMSLTDLDAELDEYMKSSKHPRVMVD